MLFWTNQPLSQGLVKRKNTNRIPSAKTAQSAGAVEYTDYNSAEG